MIVKEESLFRSAEVKNEILLIHSSFSDLLLFDSKQKQIKFWLFVCSLFFNFFFYFFV